MRILIYLLFILNIFYNQYKLVNATPMHGENVRLVREGEFTSVVSIKLLNKRNSESEQYHGCVGTVITKNKVLSVAHGVTKVSSKSLEVHMGSNDLRQGKKLEIKRVVIYNMWAVEKGVKIEGDENDVAIIVLKKDVPSEVIPAKIAFMKTHELDGKDVVTAGWGRTANGSKSRYMLTVCLKVISYKDCIQRLEDLSKSKTELDNRYICSLARPFAFLRKGDSGGPLFFEGQIVAMNKASAPFPEDNFHPDKVNVHIGLYYYRHFIRDVVANY